MSRFPASPLARCARASLAVLGLALAACGGDVSRVETYEPTRIFTLGDENSLINSDGSKYTIDGTNCAANPIWVQSLVAHYNMAYSQCNLSSYPETAYNYAALDATTADLAGQIANLDSVTLTSKDLITLWIGMHDVLNAAASSATTDAKVATVTAAGKLVAATVDALAARGARVLLVTASDVGLAPIAVASGTATLDSTLVQTLVSDFNTAMRVNIQSDGSEVGLVLADSLIQEAVKYPSTYSLTNTTLAACSTAPPACTTSTLVSAASDYAYWMWADTIHLGPNIQARIGSLAIDRAETNPF